MKPVPGAFIFLLFFPSIEHDSIDSHGGEPLGSPGQASEEEAPLKAPASTATVSGCSE